MAKREKYAISLALGIACAGLAYLLPEIGHRVLLSADKLASLRGGYIISDGDQLHGCSDCLRNVDCEDIQCSPCMHGEDERYCKGKTSDMDEVEACYIVVDPETSCSYSGDLFGTDCTVDIYSDASCTTLVAKDQTLSTWHCD